LKGEIETFLTAWNPESVFDKSVARHVDQMALA
jgi:hypothetical protein